MTNPIQYGTPASSLAPQGYKNSSQEGSVQSTLDSSSVQSSNDDLLRSEVTGKLQVVTSGNPVLGASSVADSSVGSRSQTQNGGTPVLAISLLMIFVLASVYFFRKFAKLSSLEPENENEE